MVAVVGVTAMDVTVGVIGVVELPPPPHAVNSEPRPASAKSAAHAPSVFIVPSVFIAQ